MNAKNLAIAAIVIALVALGIVLYGGGKAPVALEGQVIEDTDTSSAPSAPEVSPV